MIAEVNRNTKKRHKPYTFEDFYNEGSDEELKSDPVAKAAKAEKLIQKMRRIQAARPDVFKSKTKPI